MKGICIPVSLAIWDNMDGSRGYYAKWNVRQRKMSYDLTYMWNLKHKTNQHPEQRYRDTESVKIQTLRCREQTGDF